MKRHLTFENVLFAVLSATALVLLVTMIIGADAGTVSLAMAAAVVPGAAGGRHVTGAPLTTTLTRQVSPELLRNEIDERVARIRPSATPVDQISRCAGARVCGSMIVDYYSVDTKPTTARLTAAVNLDSRVSTNGALVYTIKTDNDAIFEASETILVPGRNGYNAQGDSCGTLVLYVVGRKADGLSVIAVNGNPSGGNAAMRELPQMPASTLLVRMARAAAELDVQTPQFNALPVKSTNNCQIFKAQVEESTYQKIANKEVGWNFSDQEEVAILDMRQGMEKNFLFGSQGRVYDPEKQEEVLLTGGIWDQAGADYTYDSETADDDMIVGLTRAAFTGNAGSTRKILVAGTDLIERLNKMEYRKVISAGDTVTHWGIDFREIRSKFGTLYVIHSEVFDACNHPADGIIIDPEYMTKYSHVPMRTERLDMKKSGIRNTQAVVVTEASCLVLRHPKAHVRVIFDE